MKIFSKICAGIICLESGLFASSAVAGIPTIDGLTDAGVITNNAATVLNVTNTGLIEKAQKEIKNAKAKYDEYKSDYEGVYNKEKAPLDGTKTIVESKIADTSDPVSVRRAMYDLFLSYPNNNVFERQKYTDKARQFYNDTINELYTSVRLLEQDFNANIKPRIETMSTDMISGENGASVGDDDNGSWKNTYNAYKTMDDVVQVLEELTAMKVQYETAKAIRDVIRPAPPPEEAAEQKESLLDTGIRMAENTSLRATAGKGEVLAFAQVQEQEYSYRYNPDSASPVKFTEAPVPDIESPFAANRGALEDLKKLNPIHYKALDALKVHNLMQSLPSKRQTFKKYEQYVRLHEKSVEAVKQSDQCVLDYLKHYYGDPENVWYGRYIGDQVTDYDLRSGLSGWAITSYDTAKAAQTTPVDTEGFAEIKYDAEIDSGDISSLEEQKESVVRESQYNSGFVKENDRRKAEENTRDMELIAWNVGAEAAKLLADDQYKSVPQWGTPIKKFPIWNDVKSFYGQYLDGKYDNMKAYLNRLNFEAKIIALAQELNKISTTKPQLKLYAERQLSNLAQSSVGVPEVDSDGDIQINTTQSAKEQDVLVLKKNKEAALRTLQRNRENYEKELDSLSEKVNEATKRLNRLQYPDMNTGEEELPEDVTAAQTETEIKNLRTQITAVQRKLDTVENKIAEIEKSYIRKEQAIEGKYHSTVADLLKKFHQAAERDNVSLAPDNENNITLVEAIGYVNGLISRSGGIFGDAKDYASKAVDRAKEDLYRMGDDLYLAQSGSKIVARHQELIRELKQIPFEAMAQSYSSVAGISGSEAAVNLVTTAFQATLLTTVCIQDSCDNPDEEYFVGSSGKARDFTAPKAAPDMPSAPIREVVHLDYVDYNNIPQLNDGSVAREGILNYGSPIPEIWKMMLKNPTFVEKDMDFDKALSLGGEQTVFMRGGVLPCRSGSFIIDALGNRAAYYVADARQSAYRKCLPLETQKISLLKNVTVFNKEIKKDSLAELLPSITAASPSELGVFLKSVDNKLYFGDIEQQTYKRISEIMNDQSQKDTYEISVPDYIYQKASFSENQIGNFLRFVDDEQEYRQILEEMKVKIDELQEEVIAELKKAGYSPAEDFNLADDDDYNEALRVLDGAKNARLSEAYTDLEEIGNPGNEVVADRISLIRNMLDSMTKDKNELLQLSQNSKNDSELDEKIKREEVNKAAADKYQQEADEEFEKEINNFEIPYCASY